MGMWLSKPSWDDEPPRVSSYTPVATTEPVRIRHRPTCYEPELVTALPEEKPDETAETCQLRTPLPK
jgi:hypothetical protein